MTNLQKILGVLVSQDLQNIRHIELFNAVSEQLGLKRDDWIDALCEIDKKFPIIAFDFNKNKKIKIKSKDKYIKYLKKLKSEYFKIFSISVVHNTWAKMANPVKEKIAEKEKKI